MGLEIVVKQKNSRKLQIMTDNYRNDVPKLARHAFQQNKTRDKIGQK